MALNSLTKHDRGDLCHVPVSNILFSQCGMKIMMMQNPTLPVYYYLGEQKHLYTHTQTHFSFL